VRDGSHDKTFTGSDLGTEDNEAFGSGQIEIQSHEWK